MNKNKLILTTLLSLFFGFMCGMLFLRNTNNTEPELPIKLEQPSFLLQETVDTTLLRQAIEYYELSHADIVIAQALLETGNFRSKICKTHNNLFGLYNSSKGGYYKFSHWSESVLAYKNKIQYRHKKGEDYYHFLKRIGYATDSMYISKVKSIVNKINKK